MPAIYRERDFVVYSAPGSVVGAAADRACRAAGFVPRHTHEADQTSIVLALVAAGLGVALLPDLIKVVLTHYFAGRRAEAAAAYARILPLVNFENRQCGLRAAKAVMQAGGVIESDTVRHPLEPLHPSTRAGLLELAAEVNPLALRWGH